MSARNVRSMWSMSRSKKMNCIMRSRGTNIIGAMETMNQVHLDLLTLKVVEDSNILLHSAMEICLEELQILSKLIIFS